MELLEYRDNDVEVLQVLKEEHPHREEKYLALAMEWAKDRIGTNRKDR